jgi:tRNA (guanine-N7-)-methyltransferase
MRLRKIKEAKNEIEKSNYYILNSSNNKGKWNKVFNNNNPIYIEIGMGKGKFIRDNAIKYPNINFIGIDKYDTLIYKAIKNIDIDIPNLKLININAENLKDIFDKEIDLIFLNFSDPWPKERHEKRRLTNEKFLKIYELIFKNTNKIILKTDNMSLFEYSLKSLNNYGYIFDNLYLNLHSNNKEDIITTEYEEKFMKKGNNIYQLECHK